jgi:hypothetical protein
MPVLISEIPPPSGNSLDLRYPLRRVGERNDDAVIPSWKEPNPALRCLKVSPFHKASLATGFPGSYNKSCAVEAADENVKHSVVDKWVMLSYLAGLFSGH